MVRVEPEEGQPEDAVVMATINPAVYTGSGPGSISRWSPPATRRILVSTILVSFKPAAGVQARAPPRFTSSEVPEWVARR